MPLNNQYQIVKTLYETNLSKTFQGIDTGTPTGRKCLIKQLKIDPYSPQQQRELKKRFEKEAQILEKLPKHQQIPFLYTYFSENNQFYLVQEWIEGKNLEETVKQRGTLPEAEVKEILIKLLPVLEFIHNEHKIIHRDIKHKNLMLDAEGLPILIDFGIVKENVTQVNPNTPFTICAGTPGFMPPEQAGGQPVFASDLYSLGLTAIYLLTGKTALDLPTANGKVSWRQEAQNISPEFAAVLDKAIEKDVKNRYATATEMLSDLTNNNQVPETELSLPPPKKGWLKIVIVAIIVAIIGAAAVAFFKGNKTETGGSEKQPQPVETPTPKITARDKFNAAVQKAEAAINQAETAPKKAELEAAKNKLEAAILELENVPKGDGIDGEIQAKESEYKGVVNRIDDALQKQPCYELLWPTDDCQEYPLGQLKINN